MRSIGLIFLVNLCFDVCYLQNDVQKSEDTKDISRSKRQIGLPLVFTYGGTYKLIVGMVSPVHAEDYINFVFAINFQYQYLELTNITEVTKTMSVPIVSREQRDAQLDSRKYERLTFYKAAEEMLTAKGINGPECVKRAICEAAQYPVEEEALVGEIVHILLTPSYGRNLLEEEDETWKSLMSDYLSAQTAGSQMFHCGSIYTECPEGQGIMELISVLHDE